MHLQYYQMSWILLTFNDSILNQYYSLYNTNLLQWLYFQLQCLTILSNCFFDLVDQPFPDPTQVGATCTGLPYMKGRPGAAVKLLPCDHEVMGSSPGNSLL
jgi:hypothetical protein